MREASVQLDEAGQLFYSSLTGELMFGATRTYPELATWTSGYARHIGDATAYDLERLMISIRYLALNKDHRLYMRPSSMVPIGSADAAYAVTENAKSQSGCCIGFKGIDGNPDVFIMFMSQVQPFVAKSSTEAEIVAANLCAEWMMWWVALLEGFGIKRERAELQRARTSGVAGDVHPFPTDNLDGTERVMKEYEILQDNLSAMHIASHPYGGFKGTKHMRVRYYYLRELIMRGEVKLVWQRSEDMVSDMLTKCVTLAVFRRLLPSLIGEQLPRVR
jgi:hypothetical protein